MKSRYIVLLTAIIVVVDQISKQYIAGHYQLGISSPVFYNILHITYWKNFGGAFGLKFPPLVLTCITVFCIIFIIVYLKNNPLPLSNISMALLLGGAFGNLLDRVRLGYVIDFIDLVIWPIFNIADIAITFGVILFAYHVIFDSNSAKKSKNVME